MENGAAAQGGLESRRLPASAKIDVTRNVIPPIRQIKAASQYLARLMRPSKLNISDLKPTACPPDCGNGSGAWVAPSAVSVRGQGDGSARYGTNASSVCCAQPGRVSIGARGSSPNRLGPLVPLQPSSSTKPQRQRTNAAVSRRRTA